MARITGYPLFAVNSQPVLGAACIMLCCPCIPRESKKIPIASVRLLLAVDMHMLWWVRHQKHMVVFRGGCVYRSFVDADAS